jgi:hypothetical protein
VILLSYKSFAQCSDAGVCQISGHITESDEVSLWDISISYKFGSSGKEDDVKFHSFQLNGSYNLFENSSVQISMPYNIQSGPNGNVSGIGDLILSWSQKLFSDNNSSLSASFGAKLATGNDDKNNLPQVYQSGLGSNDLLFVLNYSLNSISFGAGYQLSGGRNNNILRLKRGDDLLLRSAYNLAFEEFSITPQLLFIKRLSKSSIIDFNSTTEKFVEVDKSDQTQLNLLTLLGYDFGGTYTLIGEFAIPFFKRDVNVDGLTRAFSASLGVKFSIN